MKPKFFIMIVVLSLITALLPVSVFAAAPKEVTLNIRNSSGTPVELSLVNASGSTQFFTIEPGVSALTLTEGVYTFWLSLPSGNYSGRWNVNVTKTLFISKTGALGLVKMKEGKPSCGIGVYLTFASDSSVGFYPAFNINPQFANDLASNAYDHAVRDDRFTSATLGCWDGTTEFFTDLFQ